MGRIRTIKPEWLDDESLGMCSDSARLLSVGLILLADDYGNGRAHPLYLASRVWGYSDDSNESLERLAASLREIRRIGFIALYEENNQQYFHIVNWEKHQRIDNAGKPKVPPFDEGKTVPLESARGISPRVSASSRNFAAGREGKGKEEEKEYTSGIEPKQSQAKPAQSAASADVVSVFEHWVKTFPSSGGPPLKLTKARRTKVQARLAEGWSVEDLKHAIAGAKGGWHEANGHTDLATLLGSESKARKHLAAWKEKRTSSTPRRREESDWERQERERNEAELKVLVAERDERARLYKLEQQSQESLENEISPQEAQANLRILSGMVGGIGK